MKMRAGGQFSMAAPVKALFSLIEQGIDLLVSQAKLAKNA